MGCIVFKLYLDFYIFFIFTRPLSNVKIINTGFMAEFESLFVSTWDDFPWNGPSDVP